MSKASEWAERAERLHAVIHETRAQLEERPVFAVPASSPAINGRAVIGEVGDRGHLELPTRWLLSPEHAREFARWILDTFGEGSDGR